MKEQFNKEAKRGWRFAADAAGITFENASTHREGFLLQSTAIWEQSLAKKKGRLSQSQATKVVLPKHG